VTVEFQPRSVWTGLSRGLVGRCPHCGEGRMFTAYLKIAPACPACGHALGQYRADDGPAYFTILIVGHALIAPLLFSGIVLTWPIEWLLGLFVSGVVASALALLPRVKGAFVGVQWAVRDRGGV